jgi:sulfur-oxidizing protein SoxX
MKEPMMIIKTRTLILGVSALSLIAGCASMAMTDAEVDAATQDALKTSFTDKGQATVDRLKQDAVQQACSAAQRPDAQTTAKLEAEQLATVKWPSDGKWLGDWKEGEKLAQNGRGATWSDPAGSKNGGNCYNCHQISKTEISFGTIGPSLYHYGKLRGVSDPAAAQSEAIVKYTWGKLYNAKATNACSDMPRFGHEALLDEAQLRDLMALLLDPKSPVNAD